MSFDGTIIAEYAPYGALALAIFFLLFWIMRLEYRIQKLLGGKNAQTLEEGIARTHKDVQALTHEQKKTAETIAHMDKRLKRSIQNVGVVRFNPFKGTSGSNQSFAAAFLDETGNGAIISSIYSRERVSTFAKPMKEFKSEFDLTPEEKEAIAHATSEKTEQ